MDRAGGDELALRGVPQRLVGLGALELLQRIDRLALVVHMLSHRRENPRRQRVQRAEARVPRAEVERELAPGDELVEELLDRLTRSGRDRRARDLGRAHLAEVQVRREPARAVRVGGLGAARLVVRERLGAEPFETRERGRATARDRGDARDRVIDFAGGHERIDVEVCEVERVELERREHGGRQLLFRRAVAHRFQRVIAHTQELGANRARGPFFLFEHRSGEDAVRVHGHHAQLGAFGEATCPFGDPGGGEGICDDHHRALGDVVDHATVVVASAPQGEPVGQAEPRCPLGQFPGVLEDERMDPVGGVLVGRVEALVDEEGATQPVRGQHRLAEGPVVLEAVCSLHPVQDIGPFGALGRGVRRRASDGQLVGHEGAGKFMHLIA